MAEREIEKWVTIKGRRIPIYKDKVAKEVANYADIIGNSDKAMELFKRTGINLSGRLSAVNPELMTDICTTLEDLQNRFHINEATDINDMTSPRYEVEVPPGYEHVFEGEKLQDAFACADMNRMRLNIKYYGMQKDELEEMWASAAQDPFNNYHPVGTTVKDVLAHEASHSLLDKKVWELCKHDNDKYFAVQRFLTDSTEYTDMGETTLPEIKTMFAKFDKVRKKYIKYLSTDEEADRYLGGTPRKNALLRGLANPMSYGKYAICEYATRNYHELVAEAFSDFYANGQKARPLSRMLVKEMLGYE